MDRVDKATRSRLMASVRSKNTAPERQVRSLLFCEGFRFRLHTKHLPGSPDIVLPRHKTAVFVHGCFWHGHDCPRGRRPATNGEAWNAKIDRNVVRDARAEAALADAGWRVRVVWTCRLKDDVANIIHELHGS